MSENANAIQTLKEVTGLDQSSAEALLTAANGDLQLATQLFFTQTLPVAEQVHYPTLPASYSSSEFPVAYLANQVEVPPPNKQWCSTRVRNLLLFFTILALAAIAAGIYFIFKNNQAFYSGTSGSNSIPTTAPTCGTTCSPTLPASQVFNIELYYVSNSITDAQKNVFENAKARWESVINADIGTSVLLPSTSPVSPPTFYCRSSDFSGYELSEPKIVDDLLIFVDISYIDGLGSILGQAGPCSIDTNRFTRVGQMQFDSADIDGMISRQTANAVILHEMAHVLGIGTRWDDRSLVTPRGNQPTFAPASTSLHYTGANGNQGNLEVGGTGSAIVESEGGPGTARGHWSESVYDNELMTGFISAAANPMSRLTVRSLVDLGFSVDVTKADTYHVSISGRRLRTEKTPYYNDIIYGTEITTVYTQEEMEEHVGNTGTPIP